MIALLETGNLFGRNRACSDKMCAFLATRTISLCILYIMHSMLPWISMMEGRCVRPERPTVLFDGMFPGYGIAERHNPE